MIALHRPPRRARHEVAYRACSLPAHGPVDYICRRFTRISFRMFTYHFMADHFSARRAVLQSRFSRFLS